MRELIDQMVRMEQGDQPGSDIIPVSNFKDCLHIVGPDILVLEIKTLIPHPRLSTNQVAPEDNKRVPKHQFQRGAQGLWLPPEGPEGNSL